MSALVFGCSDRRVEGTRTYLYMNREETYSSTCEAKHLCWSLHIPLKIPDPRPLTCPSTAYSKSHVWFVLEKMLQHGQSPPPAPRLPLLNTLNTYQRHMSIWKLKRTEAGQLSRPQRVSQRGTGKVVAVFPVLEGGLFILSVHPPPPPPASASPHLYWKYGISFRLVL